MPEDFDPPPAEGRPQGALPSDADLALQRERMVRRQLQRRGISDPRVLAAMGRVPRERFIDPALANLAYADQALGIACGQTISQPYIVALMSQALRLTGSQRVLEIGTGSGYQTAILAELAGEVVSVERHARLSQQAGRVLAELGYKNIVLVVGDGTLGWPERAPYERIIVTAAAEDCPPALWEQLADGGILVIPLGDPGGQLLQAIHRRGNTRQVIDLSPCRFVPLIGAWGMGGEGWNGG